MGSAKKIKKVKKKKSKSKAQQQQQQIGLEYFLAKPIQPDTVPIVYRPEHNIVLPLNLQKLHPFDTTKYGNVAQGLIDGGMVQNEKQFIKSTIVTHGLLSQVHTQRYLKSLHSSTTLAQVCEVPFIAVLPNFMLQSVMVKPMKFAVGATVAAAHMAMRYGVCINLGGGFHHAKKDSGSGWCMFQDIGLAIQEVRKNCGVKKVMVVDLDAHQGNGIEADKLDGTICPKDDLYIIDFYNKYAFPGDKPAKQGINLDYGVHPQIPGDRYLLKLRQALKKGFQDFKPDLVIYNAGTDILNEDPLGHMTISGEEVVLRDQIVFETCFNHNVPITMLLSGGYHKDSAKFITKSILNLEKKFNVTQLSKNNYKKWEDAQKKKLEASDSVSASIGLEAESMAEGEAKESVASR